MNGKGEVWSIFPREYKYSGPIIKSGLIDVGGTCGFTVGDNGKIFKFKKEGEDLKEMDEENEQSKKKKEDEVKERKKMMENGSKRIWRKY